MQVTLTPLVTNNLLPNSNTISEKVKPSLQTKKSVAYSVMDEYKRCEGLKSKCEECSARGEFNRQPKVIEDLPPPQFLSREDAAWARLPDPGTPLNSKLSHAVDMPSPPAKEIIIYDFSKIMLVTIITF